MLYPILKILMKTAMRLYFRRTDLSGLKYTDNSHPALILANHTNGFMDAMVIGAVLKRKIHFFTRGDVFRHKWADKLLRSIGMLPVYRLKDGKDSLQLNEASNQAALEILSKGGAVLIFAEGASDMAKMVRPLKKGPFRLAVHAAVHSDLAPVIMPLGINYIAPEQPFTTLYVQAGPTVELDVFDLSTEAEKTKTALQLMRRTSDLFSYLAWHTTHKEDTFLTDGLLALQQRYEPSFSETHDLITMVNMLDANAKEKLHRQLIGYTALQEQLGVPADHTQRKPHTQNLLIAAVSGIPAIAGWLFHVWPVRLAERIAKKQVKEMDLYASVFLAGAIAAVLAWYLVWMIPLLFMRPVWMVLSGAASTALCGILYLKVFRPAQQQIVRHRKEQRAMRAYPQQWAEFISLQEQLLQFIATE